MKFTYENGVRPFFFKTINITFILILFSSMVSRAEEHVNQPTRTGASIVSKQEKTITGKISDSQGAPLPGVTVIVEGTTIGTVTDFDGAFSLAIPGDATNLQVSFVGMKTQIIPIGEQTTFTVTLEDETIGLEEVVAIGYGTQKRKNFTGSVTTVDVANSPVALNPSTNAMNMLRGITSGVTFSQSGEAGSTPDIMIRGQKSVNGGSEPLFIVDGVIFSGTLNDIDPSVIESMSVLKDATTLAAYGSKAANGVIMITTKKGKSGKPVISYNGSFTVSNPNYKQDWKSGADYIELLNARNGYELDADPTQWMTELEQINYAAGEETDWLDYMTRTGTMQNHSLSFSGATDNSNYFFSVGNLDQKGIYLGDQYKRTTFSANISSTINDYVKIGANTNIAYNNYDGVMAAFDYSNLSPWAEPYLLNGDTRKFPDGVEATTTNPLWDTYNTDDYDRGHTMVVGGYFDLKIPFLEGLSYKITGSHTTTSQEQRSFVHESYYPDISLSDDGYTTEIFERSLSLATGSITSFGSKSWVMDNILTYTNQFGDHFINASMVYTRNSTKVETYNFSGTDFRGIGNTTLGYYGLGNAENHKISNLSYSLHNDIGYLARASYSFKDKYHLNASLRRDGSSVFGADKKWGNFPAVGVAWTISEESFMSTVNTINNMKLKLSWGKNGNQSLAPYQTLSTVAMGRGGQRIYFFDDVAYAQAVEVLGNPGLAWETTTAINAGVETDLLKNRLHFELNGYKSKTTDQIFDRTIPVMGSGITSQNATMGQVDNWGIEIEANSVNIQSGKFSWNSGLVFTLNRNELVELYGDGQDDITNSLFIGKSLGAIYGYKTEGIVQEGEENYFSNITAQAGDAKYVDVNGDGAFTAADRTILGYGKENFRMSLSNTLSYGNIQFYFLLNGIFSGNDYGMADNSDYYVLNYGMARRNALNHEWWTPENRSNEFPKFSYINDNYMPVRSYGFVRLQDVNISYTFNSTTLSKVGIKSAKVYLSANNLFFVAPNWKGSDPEVRSTSEVSNTQRPQLTRSFTMGVNINL